MLTESKPSTIERFIKDDELALLVILERNIENAIALELLGEIASEGGLDFARIRRAAKSLKHESDARWARGGQGQMQPIETQAGKSSAQAGFPQPPELENI